MEQLKNVKLDLIRYANCWEDADLLIEGLGNQKGNKILSIASGGDNSFSLLTSNPKLVVAIDINETQLFLVELKKEAIRELNHNQFLKFVGFKDSQMRTDTYNKLRNSLSNEAKFYWDNNLEIVEKGIVHAGKFEKYFRYFSQKVLPFIHSKEMIQALLSPKSAVAQERFVANHWNTFRWRSLFKVFFSRFVLGRFGRDPKFLKEVDINVGEYLLEKANAYLSSTDCQNNWMLKYILKGSFEEALPHYAQKKNYKVIQKNIDKLVLQKGLAEDAIFQYGKFDAFNLSNIFEYMDQKTFDQVSYGLKTGSKPKAKLAYWNLMVPRVISNSLKGIQRFQKEHLADKGFFYRDFVVDQLN